MIVRSIFLVMCALSMFNAQAHAQIFVEQAKVSLTASGGEHLNGYFLVHNTSSTPTTVKVYWEDFKYKPPYNGTKEFLPAGTTPDSASQWVTFSPQSFTMPAFGQQKMEYTVAVPSQIQEGHYGVLFFERTALGTIDNNDVNLVTRIGSLFFIEPSNKIKKAVIQDISVNANDLSAHFVNQGNIILIPHTTYYVMEKNGTAILRGEAKNLYLPPGASGPLEISLKDKLKPGQYTLVINSDMEEGDVVVKEIGLSVDEAGQLMIQNSQD